MLMVTVNFDHEQFTMEETWAALRSKPIEGCESRYNLINRLDANLRKVFGPHGKLLCKEAQQNGHPSPHMILSSWTNRSSWSTTKAATENHGNYATPGHYVG